MPLSLSENTAAAGRERRVLQSAGLIGVGHAVGKKTVASSEIELRIAKPQGWIARRTGIERRNWVADGETVISLGCEAGARALASSGVDAQEIDLVIVATLCADDVIPNAAPLIAHELGAVNAGGIDVGAACAGWVYAISLAAAQVESGRAQHVLVIAAEVTTRFLNNDDPQTAGIFADGAGAAVVAASSRTGAIGPLISGCDGTERDSVVVPQGGKLTMRGSDVFRHAVVRMEETANGAVAAAGLELADIEFFVFHQANSRILDALAEQMGLPPEKVVAVIRDCGNASSASVPIALDMLRGTGQLQSGSRILLAAFGSGLTWCGTVIEWDGQ